MRTWTGDELARIGESEEPQLASTRPDGTPLPHVTMWVVRANDDLYVRSAYGRENRGTAARRPAGQVASGPVARIGT